MAERDVATRKGAEKDAEAEREGVERLPEGVDIQSMVGGQEPAPERAPVGERMEDLREEDSETRDKEKRSEGRPPER